jgi:hypothetical protein
VSKYRKLAPWTRYWVASFDLLHPGASQDASRVLPHLAGVSVMPVALCMSLIQLSTGLVATSVTSSTPLTT